MRGDVEFGTLPGLWASAAERYFACFGFAQIARDDVPGAVQQSVEFREACPASAVVMSTELSTN